MIRTYNFRPDKSVSNGEETVVVPHPLILSMVLSLNVDRMELLNFVAGAIKGLFHDPQDIFFTGRPIDLFVNGITLDCSSDAFEVSGVCAEFDSGEYKEIKRFNESSFLFSILGNVSSLLRIVCLQLSVITLISYQFIDEWK